MGDILTDLQGHWRLNETSGTSIADVTGNPSGTMVGAYTTLPAPSNFPGQTAILFASANLNGLQIADRVGLRCSTAGWTWATWIWLPAVMTDTRAIWCKNNTGFITEYEIYSAQQAAWNVVRSTSLINHQFNTPDFAVGAWRHVAVVSTCTLPAGVLNIASTYYLSGSAPVTFGPNVATALTTNTSAVQVGRRNNTVFDSHVDAAFYDMRFYNRPLELADITDLRNYTYSAPSGISHGMSLGRLGLGL